MRIPLPLTVHVPRQRTKYSMYCLLSIKTTKPVYIVTSLRTRALFMDSYREIGAEDDGQFL